MCENIDDYVRMLERKIEILEEKRRALDVQCTMLLRANTVRCDELREIKDWCSKCGLALSHRVRCGVLEL